MCNKEFANEKALEKHLDVKVKLHLVSSNITYTRPLESSSIGH